MNNYLEPLACLLYMLAVLVQYRRSPQRLLLPLLFLYLAATILLTIGCLNVGHKGNNNIWVYDLVALASAGCISAYFYQVLNTSGKKRTVIAFAMVYLVYIIVRQFTLQGPRLFDSIGYSLLSAAVVTYLFMYFHQVLKNVAEGNILREFNFWLAAGYLVYYVGSFIIFVTYFYLTKRVYEPNVDLDTPGVKADRDLLTALWGLHNVLLFVGAISLLLSSLWVNYRRKSISLSSPRFSSY